MVKETNIKKDNFEIEELTFGRKKISLSTFKNKHKNLITKNNSNTSGFDSLNLTTFIDEKNPNTIEYSLGNCKARISYIIDSNKKLNNIEIKNEEIKFSDGFYNFEYKKTKNGIKELIYINNRCEEYVFKYNVKLDNLKIEKKNNHIIFKSIDLNKTIFTLIAPFLYDSSHKFSHKVNIDICNIGNEEYELVYTYDKKRINSDERNFPIIIDPTISVNEESSEIYQLIYNESTGDWEEDLNQSSYFYIDATYRVGIYIDISQLNLSGRKITSAYLNLDFSDAGNFLVNNSLLYIDNEATIDVTDMIQNDQDVDVVIAFDSLASMVELSQNRDILVINYEEANNLIKSIPLNNNFISLNYAKTGENKIAFNDIIFDDGVFNLNVSHIFDGESQYSYGNGFKLNLNSSLIKKNDYYEYCDEMGVLHLLFKKFFITVNSQREVVAESDVEIDENLNLITRKNGKIYDVSFEYCSYDGLRLISNIENIKNIDYLEQRTTEQMNLENEIRAQEQYFLNLVFIDRSKETSESYNYGFSKPHYLNDVISFIEENYKRTYILFFDNIQISSGEERHSLQDEKRNAFGANSSCKLSTLFNVLKKYKENLVNIKSLYLKTPISFLMINDKFYGYNKFGQLCQIIDKFENYLNIVWEENNSFYGKKTIIKAVGNNNRIISFGYNYYNQLIELTDTFGTTIKYVYDGTNYNSKLIRIIDNKSNLYVLDYNNNKISFIKNNDGTLIKFIYSSNKLNSINFYNYFNLIDRNSDLLNLSETEDLSESNTILFNTVEFITSIKNINESSGKTKAYNSYKINSDGHFEQYLLGPREGEIATFKGYGSTVDDIEISKIVYENYRILVKPKKIVNSNQNVVDSKITSKLSYFESVLQNISTEFSYKDAIFELEYLDSFDRIIKKETNWSLLNQSSGVNSYITNIVEYMYSFNLGIDKVIEIKDNTYFSNDRNIEGSEKKTILTEYEYDGNNLIKVETYDTNKYLEEGKNIVEYVYDEKGNLLNKSSYNTLDASSKFYEEKEYDDKHRIIAELDELGLFKTSNKYKNNQLISIKAQEDSIIGYAYDEKGNLISLNKSTVEGKPNQTNLKYNLDYLTEAKNGNVKVNYQYDYKGRVNKVSLNNIDYLYEFKGKSNEPSIDQQSDLSGVYQESEIKGNIRFDKFYDLRSGALRQINENNIKIQKCDYNSKDLLVTSQDYIRSVIKDFNYDVFDRLVSVNSRANSSLIVNENYSYNNDGLLAAKTLGQALNQTYTFHYLNHEKLDKITLPNGYEFYIKTDKNNRYVGNKIKLNNILKFDSNILYLSQGDHTSILPSTYVFNVYDDNEKLISINEDNYIYNENKLINEIHKNHNLKNRFKYDTLGRLIREDNVDFNKTYKYFYDNEGNILESKIYDLNFDETLINEISSNKYLYQNGKLIIFNNYEISYDDCGNPLIYKGNVLRWRNKTLLSRYGNYAFSYDAEGRRIAKGILLNPNNFNIENLSISESQLSNITNFIYDNEGNLVKQINGNNIFEFVYDSTGLFGFKFNGTNYFYKKNLLNDIEEIINLSTNEVVAKYIYDARGNHKVLDSEGNLISDLNHIGNLNPFRYRSYYYDTETQLFYCNSRYYSPELCRWISPDSIEYLDPSSINGLNLYCYCMNNPIMYADPSGHLPEWAAWLISGAAIVGGIVLCATGVGGILGGVLIGAGAGSLINGYVTEANGGDFTAGYIGGAISGALCGVGAGLGGMAFAAASEVANLACIGYMALGVTASFAGGFAGNLAGTVYTSWHNSGFKSVDINWGETLATSAIMGSLNILAGMGSAMSSIAGSMGRVATDVNSKFALRFLAGLIAGGTEAAYDLTSYLIGKLISAF